jgi:hypothetical protein
MDKAAVKASVSVLEGMDINKTKRGSGGLQHWLESRFTHTLIGIQHPFHQILQVGWPRSDKFGQRVAVMVVLAVKNSVRTKSRVNKTLIFDQNAVQPHDFLDR